MKYRPISSPHFQYFWQFQHKLDSNEIKTKQRKASTCFLKYAVFYILFLGHFNIGTCIFQILFHLLSKIPLLIHSSQTIISRNNTCTILKTCHLTIAFTFFNFKPSNTFVHFSDKFVKHDVSHSVGMLAGKQNFDPGHKKCETGYYGRCFTVAPGSGEKYPRSYTISFILLHRKNRATAVKQKVWKSYISNISRII